MSLQKYYPVQGTNKFETTSYPIAKTFKISATVNTGTGTWTLHNFPKGSCVLGFVGRVTAVFSSTGSATVQIGFTGKDCLSAALQITSIDAVHDIIAPANSVSGTTAEIPYVLTADDTFDVIVGTAKLSGGKADITVFYYPPADSDAGSEFREYYTS